MMKKWDKMKEAVLEANSHENVDIILPPSNKRSKDSAKKKLCLNDVYATPFALQKRCLTVADDRKMTEEVNDNWDNEDSHWCDKTFGDTYIPSTSAKRLNQDFANAVCKCKM